MQVRLFPLATALALLLVALPGWATTVIQPTFREMVASADYIVRVEVTSVISGWRANPSKPGERYIGSKIALTVRDVIKGTPPQPLVLDVVGGFYAEASDDSVTTLLDAKALESKPQRAQVNG